jgi:ABC-2 type transport system permease protein
MTAVAVPGAHPADHGTPLGRLLRVELRKVLDTRAGMWLLVAVGLLTAAAVVIHLFAAKPAELTFRAFVDVTVVPLSALLPVLGILAVTTEWTQRTGLVTHSLEPRRGRVLAMKFAATGIVGASAIGLALAAATVANVLGMAMLDGNGSWAYGASDLRDTVLFQGLSLLQGLALGALLMNTAAALAGYFVLPTVFYLLFAQIHGLHEAAPWIDLGTSQDPLLSHTIDGVEWVQLTATTIWWILLPLVAGVWRLLHREIK